jgi:ketosteroid isomerase-like protein
MERIARGACWSVALVAVFAGIACSRDAEAMRAADVQKIEALYADYRKAVESSDIAGYRRVLHPEVRLLPPGAPAIDTAERYGQFLEPVFAAATYRIDVDRAPDVVVLGDVAVAEYDYTIHLSRKDPEVGVSEPGALTAAVTSSRYFDVLRKTDAGEWRIWRHSWQPLRSTD